MFIFKLFQKQKELPDILKEASDYAHEVITCSASLESTPPEDIAFNDMSVSNMRSDICMYAKVLNPDLYSDSIPDELSYTDPEILEISKRNILGNRAGNCGEYLVLALTYMLEKYKDQLMHVTFRVMCAGTQGHLNHVYLHIEDRKNNKTYFFDPTCQQIAPRDKQTGNVYIRGKKGKPNRYHPITTSDTDYIEQAIATIHPGKIQYPLSNAETIKIDSLLERQRHDNK
jgi:hypothetical protein